MATVNDILRATQNFNIAGNSIGNMVWHFRVTVGTETNYITIATAIDVALATAFVAAEIQMSNVVSPISLELSEWDTVNLEWDGKASVTGTSPDGGSIGDQTPTGIACVMRFPTAELRRQARKFVPGILENDTNNDAIAAGPLANFVISAALLNNDITAGGVTLRPCTFNDTVGSIRFNTFSDYSTTSIVNTNVGYQRKRQPGDGI